MCAHAYYTMRNGSNAYHDEAKRAVKVRMTASNTIQLLLLVLVIVCCAIIAAHFFSSQTFVWAVVTGTVLSRCHFASQMFEI